jgi:hypothetical protein
LVLLAFLIGYIYGQVVVTTTTGPNIVKVAEVFNFGRVLDIQAIALIRNNKTDTLDAVQFVFSDLLQASIIFNYYTATFVTNIPSGNGMTPSSVTGALQSLGFRAFAVFEFVNNDGVPGYQETTGANADTITGAYDLSNALLNWNPITVGTTVITGANGAFNATTVTASTTDNVFLLRFVYAGTPVLVDGVATINPNQIKVDFEIQWFNNSLNVPSFFSTGPSSSTAHPNAQVGLATIASASSGTFSQTNGTSSFSLTFTVANFSTSFSGANGVTVYDNGIQVTGQVYADIKDNTQNTYVNSNIAWASNWVTKIGFFSFSPIRPSHVVWDPVVGQAGVTAGPTSTSTSTSAGVTSASPFVALVLLVIMFLQF